MQLSQSPQKSLHKEERQQQKPSRAILHSLATATCGLLGAATGSSAVASDNEPGDWSINAAVLYYAEDNGRVQAAEPVVSATRYFNDDKKLNIKLALDTLTGASPSGLVPSSEPQTFTKPSGRGSTYTIEANEDTLDPSFKDGRGALTVTWSQPLNSDWEYSTGLYFSTEYDYQSLGLNGSLSRYFNQKNTQLNLGLSLSADSIDPVGGAPFGLSRVALPSMPNFDTAFADSREKTSDTKSLYDVVIGVTQVINKRTIMQLNYSLSSSSGYLSDAYKMLTIVDDDSNSARYGDFALDTSGDGIYVHEERPDSRLKHALYWEGKYMRTNEDVITGSYRFMTDDWGISSHTIDLKYLWQFDNSYIEPHIRLYQQSEADFYKRYITQSEYDNGLSNITAASADYRLGDMSAITAGIKYAKHLKNDRSFSVRLEYYMQTSSGEKGFGQMSQQELYPDTNAILTTIGYSF